MYFVMRFLWPSSHWDGAGSGWCSWNHLQNHVTWCHFHQGQCFEQPQNVKMISCKNQLERWSDTTSSSQGMSRQSSAVRTACWPRYRDSTMLWSAKGRNADMGRCFLTQQSLQFVLRSQDIRVLERPLKSGDPHRSQVTKPKYRLHAWSGS